MLAYLYSNRYRSDMYKEAFVAYFHLTYLSSPTYVQLAMLRDLLTIYLDNDIIARIFKLGYI